MKFLSFFIKQLPFSPNSIVENRTEKPFTSFCRTLVLFLELLISFRFKAIVELFTCVIYWLCMVDSSDSAPANLLADSMAAKSLLPTYFF